MISGFGTEGLDEVSPGVWRDPRSGDGLALVVHEGPLRESAWLEDVPAMRASLARGFAGSGCLIEATPVSLGGVPAVYQLVKLPRPTPPGGGAARGVVFLATFTVAKQLGFVTLQYLAQESEPTGMREAVLHAQLGMSMDESFPHPYDAAVESLLPFSRCDDPIYDTMFPEHPLTRVRAWAERVARTATVDAAFATLPDFVPGDPAAAAYGYRPGTGGAGWEELQALADRGQLYAELRNAQLQRLVEPLGRATW